MKGRIVLAADIGGTKVSAALYEFRDNESSIIANERYLSKEFASFEEIILKFLNTHKYQPEALSVGVAGPVTGPSIQLTNLDWEIDCQRLKDTFHVQNVFLLNDLEAHGWGIIIQDEGGIKPLRNGVPKKGNKALIAAGTGLGESVLFWNGADYLPSSTEGGHTSFSPCTEEEIDLLRFVMKEHRHVSMERLVSGSLGIPLIFKFYAESGRYKLSDELQSCYESGTDIAPVLQVAADEGEQIAVDTIRLFMKLYGAETGNLALKSLAVGGVYIAGGMVRRLMPWIENGDFLKRFDDKGRFKKLLQEIPVYIVTDRMNALKGAAYYALKKIT